MPSDLVRIPLTLNGGHDRPVGFVMIETEMVEKIEALSQRWGIGFTIAVNGQIEHLRAIDIYPHEARDGSNDVEATAREIRKELSSGGC